MLVLDELMFFLEKDEIVHTSVVCVRPWCTCLLQWFGQIHGLPSKSLSLSATIPVVYVSLTVQHVIIGARHKSN